MKKIFNYIPGFRSGVTWKKVVASVYYVAAVFFGFALGLGGFLLALALPVLMCALIDLLLRKRKGVHINQIAATVLVGVLLAVVGVPLLDSGSNVQTSSGPPQEEYKEPGKKELTEHEKELLSKSYDELDYAGRTMFADIVKKFKELPENIQNEHKASLDRLSAEKEAWQEKQRLLREEEAKKPENRKRAIESAIKGRVNEGDYRGVSVDKITINEDMGKNEKGYYIVLVNLNFEVPNREKTANEMMRMYSDDLVASLAKKGIADVSEAAVFWKDKYNNRNLKYAYEYRNGGFYITDIMGE